MPHLAQFLFYMGVSTPRCMTRKIKWLAQDASPTENFLFVVDIVMMLIIIINLLFIIFDWTFGFAFFQHFISNLSPRFFSYYRDVVHPDFLLYDINFVIVFVAELAVRWIIAWRRKTYTRWYFYPLVHWYDVLGCIPIGAFRWLRLLRVFAIVTRLHKMGIIDLRQTLFFKQGYRIWEIFLEEVTDRVFINLLEAAKQ
jgi:hypothetical protein